MNSHSSLVNTMENQGQREKVKPGSMTSSKCFFIKKKKIVTRPISFCDFRIFFVQKPLIGPVRCIVR